MSGASDCKVAYASSSVVDVLYSKAHLGKHCMYTRHWQVADAILIMGTAAFLVLVKSAKACIAISTAVNMVQLELISAASDSVTLLSLVFMLDFHNLHCRIPVSSCWGRCSLQCLPCNCLCGRVMSDSCYQPLFTGCLQEGRMPTHLDHMREHVVHGTTMNSSNIAVDRCCSYTASHMLHAVQHPNQHCSPMQHSLQ